MRAQFTAGLFTVATALVAALGAAGCEGKGTEGTCTTYPACGGDPKGNWILQTGCQNLVVMPYQAPSLPDQLAQPQTSTQAPPQPQPTTSGDWCSQLIYQPSINPNMPVRGVVLWHGPPTVHDGFLNLIDTNGTKTYTAEIQFRTTEHTFFDNACLTRYESVAPPCKQLGDDLATYLMTNPSFMFGNADMACTGDSSVGCDCSYVYQVQALEMGTWMIDPANQGSVVFSSTSRSEPQAASFCQSGSSLQLSGDDGTNLFSAQGVRSAQYTRM
jgi:hypothetical protein